MKGISSAVVIALVAVVVIVLGIIGWYFGTYNSLVTKQIAVDNQWAQVQSQYQRRYDLIPNLVESVRGYMKFENATLTQVTALRSQWGAAQTPSEKIAASGELETAISKLLVVMENYPDLKSSTLVQGLMDELAGTENRIAVERMRYNDIVNDYNTAIRIFPNSIVAGMYGFTPRPFFNSTVGASEAPKVNITI